jgi:hypothetical protein
MEKMGIFWLSTRQLNTSIIGTWVWIIFDANTADNRQNIAMHHHVLNH